MITWLMVSMETGFRMDCDLPLYETLSVCQLCPSKFEQQRRNKMVALQPQRTCVLSLGPNRVSCRSLVKEATEFSSYYALLLRARVPNS